MIQARRKSSNVLLDTALQEFYGAADEMGLKEELITVLSHSERRMQVSIPVEMDDGSVNIFEGYRVQHSTALGPSKGGVRYDPEVDMDYGRVRGFSDSYDLEMFTCWHSIRRR